MAPSSPDPELYLPFNPPLVTGIIPHSPNISIANGPTNATGAFKHDLSNITTHVCGNRYLGRVT